MNSKVQILGTGAGGKAGGSGGRVAIEAKDSLRSVAYAKVLDLISEGEIEGLYNGLKSVYLDGTPVENADGTTNFTGITINAVPGTQNQARLPGFMGSESESNVNVEVKAATPVIRTVTSIDVDAVRIRITIPNLSVQNVTNGDLTGTTVRIAIDIQSNGGGYVTQIIGHEWQATINPATLTSIGLAVDIAWLLTPVYIPDVHYRGGGHWGFNFVKYDVQYREVGAGSWTTLASGSATTADLAAAGRGQYYQTYGYYDRAGNFVNPAATSRIPKTYTIAGLPELIYEARVVVTGGAGSATVQAMRFLTQVAYDDITGKASSTYQRSYRRKLIGSPPWNIRVRRITPDAVSVSVQNKTYFDSITEIVDDKINYANSALVGLSIDASQFSAIPVRGYDVKLLKVRIPDNYDPIARTYTGIWSGAFVIAWTDNPAWCFYDLLINTRYGLGNFLPAAKVDKFALYTIAKYCDGLVPDGLGGQEPRFTCNLYLQTQQEAFQVITSMASMFRGMAYWANGSITAVQDAPADPVFLFTEANVEEGIFTYTGTAKQAGHTVALVSWNDPDDGYKLKPEYVEDLVGVARYGVISTQVVAIGAASRGQARRFGKWILFSERLETEVVSFKCGYDGIFLRPGTIFAVQDQHRAGIRYGGRILSATAGSVTLDKAITIVALETYSIQVVLPDGTLATKTVTNAAGSASVLTISVNFAVTPLPAAVWIVTSSSLNPQTYRALSIGEVEKNKYEITGVEHNPTKFDLVEQDEELVVQRTTTVTAVPTAPENVTIVENLVIRQGIVVVVLTVTWEPVAYATSYKVQYRRDSGNYVTIDKILVCRIEVADVQPGFYEVLVTAANILAASSLPGTASSQLYGKTLPPADITNFIVARNNDVLLFTWDRCLDLDFDHYELRQGTQWETAIVVGARIMDNRFQTITHTGGVYLVKSVDSTGNESVIPALINIAPLTDINLVVFSQEDPAWAGTMVNLQADSEGLTLIDEQRWNLMTGLWNTYTDTWYQSGDWASPGTYETVPVDLTQVMTSRVEVSAVTEQIGTSDGNWLQFTDPWLSYTSSWTGTTSFVSITYEIATSLDGVSYSSYSTFQAGFYTARAFKFRITLTSTNSNFIPRLKSFSVTVDVPDRVLHFEDEPIAIGGTVLTFTPAFVVVQTVTGTIQGGAIGDTFRVTAKSPTSATVQIYDAAGNPKVGLVDIDAFGYGEV